MAIHVARDRIKSQSHYRVQHVFNLLVVNGILWIAVVVSLYPIIMMIVNSFKERSDILVNPSGLPALFTTSNYVTVLMQAAPYFLNAILVATVTTVLSVFLAALAAFAFAKYEFPGRNIIFVLLLTTILVPSEISIAPLYLIFSGINWIDTYQVQIVPALISVFGMFMIRQYMLSIPNSLLDAARIDGANDWLLFWRIIVPTCTPVLSAFATLQFLGMWNNYLWPLIVANDSSVEPIMVFLPNLRDQVVGFLPDWGTIMAGCVLTSVPVMIVFLLFQKRFISGVVVGSVK